MKNKRRPFTIQKKKKCPFCADKTKEINYKDPSGLRKFITDRGKILPGKITGVCSKHQRKLTVAIKRSRLIALLPFVTD